MPDTEFTQMDFVVLRCLARLRDAGTDAIQPAELTPLLAEELPGYDEVSMRQGISTTRLRGRGLIDIDSQGRLGLTAEGLATARGL